MVTILVLAILLGIAVPSFRDASLGARLTGYANDMVASAQLARSEAIKRNAAVVLCASAVTDDGDFVCSDDNNWESGWVVGVLEDATRFDEDGNPITVTIVNVIQRQPALDPEFRFTADVSTITFPPTVVGVTAANFTVCRFNPLGKQERLVRITATGATSVIHPTTTSSCPGA